LNTLKDIQAKVLYLLLTAEGVKPENLLWLDKLLFVFLLLLTLYLGALIGQVFCLVLKSGFLLLENSGNSSFNCSLRSLRFSNLSR
jgi:hypothetical protein